VPAPPEVGDARCEIGKGKVADEAEAEDFTADYFTNIIGYGIKDGESIKAIFDRETA